MATRPRRTSLRFVEGQTYDPSPTPEPKRLSCREAAGILGPTWSEDRVLSFCRSGVIPSYRVGSRTYLLESELKEWMDSPRSLRVREANLLAQIDAAIAGATKVLAELQLARQQIGGGNGGN